MYTSADTVWRTKRVGRVIFCPSAILEYHVGQSRYPAPCLRSICPGPQGSCCMALGCSGCTTLGTLLRNTYLYTLCFCLCQIHLTSAEVLGAAVMVTHQWKLNHPCQCGLCPHHLFNSQLKFPSMIKQTKDVNVYHCFSPLVMSSQWQHKLIPSICFVFHMTFFLLFHKNSKLIRYLRGSLITQ